SSNSEALVDRCANHRVNWSSGVQERTALGSNELRRGYFFNRRHRRLAIDDFSESDRRWPTWPRRAGPHPPASDLRTPRSTIHTEQAGALESYLKAGIKRANLVWSK